MFALLPGLCFVSRWTLKWWNWPCDPVPWVLALPGPSSGLQGPEHLLSLPWPAVGGRGAVPVAQAQRSLSRTFRHAEVASSPTAAAPELKPEDVGCDTPMSLTIGPWKS